MAVLDDSTVLLVYDRTPLTFPKPPADSDELIYLARRMEYEPIDDVGPADQLLEEFDARTGAIRAFVEKHFGRPCPGS